MHQTRPGWERYLPFVLLAGVVGCVLLLGWRWVGREREREREHERERERDERSGEPPRRGPIPSLTPARPPYLVARLDLPGAVYAAAFTPNKAQLLIAGSLPDRMQRDQPTVWVWNPDEERETTMFRRQGEVGRYTAVAVSPDGKAAAATGLVIIDGRTTGHVCVWNLETGGVRWARRVAKRADRVAWSPDGELVAVGDQAGTTAVWDATGGEPRGSVPPPKEGQPISALAWSHDGKRLAVGNGPGVRVWDVAEGREVGTLDTEKNAVSGLAFGPEDRSVFGSLAARGAVWEWDLSGGKRRTFGDSSEFVAGFVLNPGARSFVTVTLPLLGSPDPRLNARGWDTAGHNLWTVGLLTDDTQRAPFAVASDAKRIALGVRERSEDGRVVWAVEVHDVPPLP